MRRIAVMLGLVGALTGAMGVECEAATFTCTDAGTDQLRCFCKVDASECGDMGDCMVSCTGAE